MRPRLRTALVMCFLGVSIGCTPDLPEQQEEYQLNSAGTGGAPAPNVGSQEQQPQGSNEKPASSAETPPVGVPSSPPPAPGTPTRWLGKINQTAEMKFGG